MYALSPNVRATTCRFMVGSIITEVEMATEHVFWLAEQGDLFLGNVLINKPNARLFVRHRHSLQWIKPQCISVIAMQALFWNMIENTEAMYHCSNWRKMPLAGSR